MIALIVKYARENLALIVFEGALVAITPCRWLELFLVIHGVLTIMAFGYGRRDGLRVASPDQSLICLIWSGFQDLLWNSPTILFPGIALGGALCGIGSVFWGIHTLIMKTCCGI